MKTLPLYLIALFPVVYASDHTRNETYSIEIGAVSNKALDGAYKEDEGDPHAPKINMYGADLSFTLQVAERHKLLFRVGYMAGSETVLDTMDWYEGYSISYSLQGDLRTFYFMPGYRYEYPVTEKTLVYLGGNVGLASASADVRLTFHPSAITERYKLKDTDFCYSVEMGVRQKVSERVSVYAAVTASKIMAKPFYEDMEMAEQTYIGLRMGVSIGF